MFPQASCVPDVRTTFGLSVLPPSHESCPSTAPLTPYSDPRHLLLAEECERPSLDSPFGRRDKDLSPEVKLGRMISGAFSWLEEEG